MKTAKQFKKDFISWKAETREEELMIKFSNDHFDQAIEELENRKQYLITAYGLNSLRVIELHITIKKLKDYKPKIK